MGMAFEGGLAYKFQSASLPAGRLAENPPVSEDLSESDWQALRTDVSSSCQIDLLYGMINSYHNRGCQNGNSN